MLLDSCTKSHLLEEFLLTDEMKNQNPYKVDDKIVFISNNGQVSAWNVKGRYNKVDEVYAGINTKEYYILEEERTSISNDDSTNNDSFQLKMGGHLSKPPKFLISFYNNGNNSGFEFNLPFSPQTSNSLDSLYVVDRWVRNVFFCENDKSDLKAYRIYYSTIYGIIKIDFSDGSFWERSNLQDR
jgi:hypothetical protein